MIDLVATCPEEIKPVLADEIRASGGSNIKFDYRAVNFQTDLAGFYQAHLNLRTASRIFMVIKEVAARQDYMLRSQAFRLPWEEYLKPEMTFLVDGVQANRGPQFMSSNVISKAVREGLQKRFESKVGKVPQVSLKEPDIRIIAYCKNNRCTISLDTSGKALHKRGYRLGGHPAPLKETLAAGILKLIGYDGRVPLYDPMCGSGTLVIEAAMIALEKAPLIHRKKGEFGFEHLKTLDKVLWREQQNKVRQNRISAPVQPLYASDIDASYVSQARDNALRARVEKDISFFQEDFLSAKPPCVDPGVLVFNMPYGERLSKDDAMNEFMAEVGRKLKFDFPGWRAAVIVAQNSPYKLIGLRPERKINLMNGSIPVKLLVFNLYKGKKS